MKIGISGFAWTSDFKSPHLASLPAIKRLGLSALEIPMFDPRRLPIEEIKLAFESNGLECTVCAILPTEINPISPDRLIRKQSIEHLRGCIHATAAMGAKLIGGPLFAPIGYLPEHRPNAEEWNWAIEAFRSLREDLERAEVTLSIEPVNRSETFFLRTTAEAARLCEAIDDPRIGVTIDTFHANIEERDICSGIRLLGPNLKHVHASENDRGPLGRGHVPFREIVAVLKEIDYQGYLMIEGFGYSPGEGKSPGYLWADPHVSPDRLAEESYEYLKALLAD
ncbi:MAG TPA: sugar phosphate isomerase/epimerase family protein [Terriglobales bacterium]|nr:sugar phosphate isomerase/epimerase family protein [Terriglobales bacterium]